jgi:uncharacterized membrane protein (Fun14 family)
MGGGFFVSILIGYVLKKAIKIVAVIFGLFFLAGLAYLQYNQIANINWNKLQTASEGTITTLSNPSMQIPGISSDGYFYYKMMLRSLQTLLILYRYFGLLQRYETDLHHCISLRLTMDTLALLLLLLSVSCTSVI